MKILIAHNNCPAQYKNIILALCQNPENHVTFICNHSASHLSFANLRIIKFSVPQIQDTSLKQAHLVGSETRKLLSKLKVEERYIPDIILCHPAWGHALFMKDVYPNTPLLSYVEDYPKTLGQVTFHDPLTRLDNLSLHKLKIKASLFLLALQDADWLISPTHWQAAGIPQDFQHKLSVLYDGVDTDLIRPNGLDGEELKASLAIPDDAIIITHVARNFEPVRGFVTIMKSLPQILANHPKAHIIMVGDDAKGYGDLPDNASSWKELLDGEIEYDKSRVHFVGKLKYKDYLTILNLSDIHIYLTQPFVLSWSLFEALASGCCVISSATRPVLEVLEDNHNACLIDFYSSSQLIQTVAELIADADKRELLGTNARQTALAKYSLKQVMNLHLRLIEQVACGEVSLQTQQEIKQLNPKVEEFYNFTTYDDTTSLKITD